MDNRRVTIKTTPDLAPGSPRLSLPDALENMRILYPGPANDATPFVMDPQRYEEMPEILRKLLEMHMNPAILEGAHKPTSKERAALLWIYQKDPETAIQVGDFFRSGGLHKDLSPRAKQSMQEALDHQAIIRSGGLRRPSRQVQIKPTPLVGRLISLHSIPSDKKSAPTSPRAEVGDQKVVPHTGRGAIPFKMAPTPLVQRLTSDAERTDIRPNSSKGLKVRIKTTPEIHLITPRAKKRLIEYYSPIEMPRRAVDPRDEEDIVKPEFDDVLPILESSLEEPAVVEDDEVQIITPVLPVVDDEIDVIDLVSEEIHRVEDLAVLEDDDEVMIITPEPIVPEEISVIDLVSDEIKPVDVPIMESDSSFVDLNIAHLAERSPQRDLAPGSPHLTLPDALENMRILYPGPANDATPFVLDPQRYEEMPEILRKLLEMHMNPAILQGAHKPTSKERAALLWIYQRDPETAIKVGDFFRSGGLQKDLSPRAKQSMQEALDHQGSIRSGGLRRPARQVQIKPTPLVGRLTSAHYDSTPSAKKSAPKSPRAAVGDQNVVPHTGRGAIPFKMAPTPLVQRLTSDAQTTGIWPNFGNLPKGATNIKSVLIKQEFTFAKK